MCFFLHRAVVPFFFCIFARYKMLFVKLENKNNIQIQWQKN